MSAPSYDPSESEIQYALAEVHMATAAAETATLRRAQAIHRLVQACTGNQSEASRRLGLHQSTVNKLLHRYTSEELADTAWRYGDPVRPGLLDEMIGIVGSAQPRPEAEGARAAAALRGQPGMLPVAPAQRDFVTMTASGISAQIAAQALAEEIRTLPVAEPPSDAS